MYFSLTALTALSILSANALAAPADLTFDLNTRQADNATNNPSDPGYMAGTNQTVSAWTRSGCGSNSNGGENVFFPNILYNKNNHALVVSYMLGRDLLANEQLDMSFAYADGHTVDGPDGTPKDKECALFQYTASPDATSKAVLKANTCYTPSVPITCFNLWRTS